MRIKAEVLLLFEGATKQAEDLFHRCLALAHRQGALSWELRAAASLARALRDRSRQVEALAVLEPVYDRFTEGFETADLKAATTLLSALSATQ
jgi:predicted ATPase